jgi:hypothetical protein
VFLGYPTLPRDVTPGGREGFTGLSFRHALPQAHLATQLASYAAAELLVAGLEGCGRDLTRACLVARLEDLQGFDTGVAPPLRYGPGRRIGALGAHVVVVDLKAKQYRPVGPWVPVD